MSLLPHNTTLGSLKVVEVFADHDFPVVFACKNSDESLFLAIWIAETHAGRGWLYAAISPVRLGQIRDQRIPIRDVYTSAESNEVFVVSIPNDDTPVTIETLNPAQLTEAMLPAVGAVAEEIAIA